MIRQQEGSKAIYGPALQRKTNPQPRNGRILPWIIGLVFIPVCLLAAVGLLALLIPLPVQSGVGVSPSAFVVTEPTSNVVPTHTSKPTSLPNPVPIYNTNIDEIRELYYWPAGETIVNLTFSPDGEYIASGDHLGTVKVWRLWTDRPVFELSGTVAAFSPNGRWIGVAGPAGLDLHNAADGEWVRSLDGSRPYHSVVFSPDSQLIVGGSEFDEFYIWSVNDDTEQKFGGAYEAPIHSLFFSRDGHFLAVASQENADVWNLEDKVIHFSVDYLKQKPVYQSIAMDTDGQWIATGLENGQIYIWRISNGEQIAVLDDGKQSIHSLQFFHGVNYPEILVSGDEVGLSVWSLAGNEASLRRAIDISTPILNLSISLENNVIATGGADGVIHLWGVVP